MSFPALSEASSFSTALSRSCTAATLFRMGSTFEYWNRQETASWASHCFMSPLGCLEGEGTEG